MTPRIVTTALLLTTVTAGPTLAQDGPTSFVVDRAQSSLYVVTHRAGLFSFLGHEHAIVPGVWTAGLCLGTPLPHDAHGHVHIQASSLVVDTDSARAVAGLEGGPGPEDRAEIQVKMLDAEHLDATAYPSVELSVDSIEARDGGELRAFGRIELHGRTRSVTIPVEVEALNAGALLLRGVLTIRQRDFGIEPESKAGVVKVADEVDLHFTLVAFPTERACDTGEAPRRHLR